MGLLPETGAGRSAGFSLPPFPGFIMRIPSFGTSFPRLTGGRFLPLLAIALLAFPAVAAQDPVAPPTVADDVTLERYIIDDYSYGRDGNSVMNVFDDPGNGGPTPAGVPLGSDAASVCLALAGAWYARRALRTGTLTPARS